MRHVVQEWCTAAFERLKIHGFIVWRARLPTPIEDAHPCAGQGAHGCLVRLALVALRLGVALRPEGMPGGFRRPLHTRVAQERRTLEAPVDPGFLAAAFRHGRNPRIFLEFLGRSVAFPLCATGHEEAGGTDGPGAWQGVKQREVGMVLGAWRDGGIEVGNGVQGDAELGHEGVHQEGVGGDDPCIRGQRHSALDGREAGRDDVGRAHVVGPEEALQRGATRALRRCARRPVTEDVAKDRRIFVLKPLQDVGKGVFEGPGHAGGEPHGVADQAPAVFDALRSGAHRRAVGGERRALVAVCEQQLDLERGIGGVIFGMARGKRFAVLRQGERMDGKEHEEIIGAQRGHDGPFLECQAHRDGLSVAARAQGLAPRIDRLGAVCEHEKLPSLSASSLEAHIVCGIRPVEANKGRKGCACLWLHG